MANKVLLALTSHAVKGSSGQPTGFYLAEAAHPWHELRKAGFQVNFVSVLGGKPPMDGADNPDAISQAFLNDPQVQQQLANTPTAAQLNPKDYAAILFVGGHGAMWDFPDDEDLAKLAAAIYEHQGVVAAVCHGPAALVNPKLSDGNYLIKGKRVAAFTNQEEDAVGLSRVVPFLLASKLQERGAKHIPAPNWAAQVVVDGHLVTGQNPASATGVGQAMAELLETVRT